MAIHNLKPLGETNSLFRAAEVAACMQGSTVVDPPRLWVGLGWQGVVRACPARRRARDGLRRRFFTHARTNRTMMDRTMMCSHASVHVEGSEQCRSMQLASGSKLS